MLDRIELVKRKMDEVLDQLCKVSWMFSAQPGKDFSRNRKLSFPKIVSFLLAMEGGTLTTELLKHFGCSPDTASASALVQQRKKLAAETFPALFDLFVRKTQPLKYIRAFACLLRMVQTSEFQAIQSIPLLTTPAQTVKLPIIFSIWMLFMIYCNVPIRMLLYLETEMPMSGVYFAKWSTVLPSKMRLLLLTEATKATMLWLIYSRKAGSSLFAFRIP